MLRFLSVLPRRACGLLALLAAFALAGCDPCGEGCTLNAAIIQGRKDKSAMSVVRTVAKERRSEANGVYSFFDAEEPSGRPFVVQTREKLTYNREYLLQGRVENNRRHVGGDATLFVVEGTVGTPMWPWLLLALVLVACGAVAYFCRDALRNLFNTRFQPPKVHHATEFYEGTLDGFGPVPTNVPAFSVQPGTPGTVSRFNYFPLAYDPDRSEEDANGALFTPFAFGRAEENDVVLNAKYIKRLAHFEVRMYQKGTAYLEMNPESTAPFVLKAANGDVLPLAPRHAFPLPPDCVLTIGDIKLKFTTPYR